MSVEKVPADVNIDSKLHDKPTKHVIFAEKEGGAAQTVSKDSDINQKMDGLLQKELPKYQTPEDLSVDGEGYLEPEKIDFRRKEEFFGSPAAYNRPSPPMVPINPDDSVPLENKDPMLLISPKVTGDDGPTAERSWRADIAAAPLFISPRTVEEEPVKRDTPKTSELDGVDWDRKAAIRKERLSRGSMPNIMSMPAAFKLEQPAAPQSFSRTASSAEDETVGALRTRVMNASFSRRKSVDSAPYAHKTQSRGSTRRMSMPHISKSMPPSAMRKVRLDYPSPLSPPLPLSSSPSLLLFVSPPLPLCSSHSHPHSLAPSHSLPLPLQLPLLIPSE